MKMLITGSVAALAIALITGPVLIQPAFAEEPDSVNVGSKSIGADPSGSKCAAISTNVTSAVVPATYSCSAMLTRTRPAPSGFIEPCLGGRMPRK